MSTLVATKEEAEVVKTNEPMAWELADWLRKLKPGEIAGYDVLKKQIKEILLDHNRWTHSTELWPEDVHRWMTGARRRLERHYQLTVVCIKGIGYKIATEREATRVGVSRHHKFFLLAQLCEDIRPLMNRKYVWEDFKEIFSKAEQEAIRAQKVANIFLPAYNVEVTKERKVHKSNGKTKKS